MAPWIARSQYALTPRNVSAGPIAPQHYAQNRALERAPSSRNGSATDDDGGDHFELEAEPGVGRNLVEPHRVQHRGEAGQRAE